jgi:hypothetical protein
MPTRALAEQVVPDLSGQVGREATQHLHLNTFRRSPPIRLRR